MLQNNTIQYYVNIINRSKTQFILKLFSNFYISPKQSYYNSNDRTFSTRESHVMNNTFVMITTYKML
jgi:hypothetical protein